MAASMFYYYSAEYKKIKIITWILQIDLILFWLIFDLISQEMFPGYQINLRNNANLKQQPLKGEIFKIFGKGGEPYMGGLRIL